jgi:LPPG:FO 2-phospho-L-lactate transferase
VICVLAGGVGAARLLAGLVQVVPPADITVVGNVGDDLVLHGLHISPDLDTITYTLADQVDPDRGWGLRDETWQAMDMVGRYGGVDWFNLGDRDLGTHLYRTHRLSEGATLGEVTAEIVAAWQLGFRLLPVTDDVLHTRVTRADVDEQEVSFQEYFVKLRHDVPVRSVRFVGEDEASPAPGVLEAILEADTVIVAPSNPLVSIGPLLAVPGVEDAVRSRRDDVVAVSPIVAGAALKGPADRLMVELGHEASVVGVARIYSPLAATLVIDDADAALAPAVEAEGMRAVTTSTVMATPAIAAALARTVVGVGA